MESSVNKPSDVIENIDLSISVQNVINRLSNKGKVNAKEIVDELLSDHTGYARGKFPPNYSFAMATSGGVSRGTS